MEVKWGPDWFIEVGRGRYRSLESARKAADSFEVLYNLNCVVEKMGKSYKIFGRGNKYHEIGRCK